MTKGTWKDEKQRLERRVSELEKQLAAMQMIHDSIPDPIFYKDVKGLYTGCNRAFESFLGKKADEIIGKNVFDLSPLEIARVYHEKDQDLINGQEGVQRYEWKVRDSKGVTKDVIFSKARLLRENGEPAGLVGVITDITQRKNMEKKLSKREEEYRLLFEYSPVGIIHINEQGLITNCNDEFIKILNSSKEKMIGLDIQKLPQKEVVEAIMKAIRGEIGLFEGRYQSFTSGKKIHTRAIFTPIKNPDDQVKGVIGIIEDVTEEKKAEKALKEANQQLAMAKKKAEEANKAKSRYLADMSHEIRTPINGILGFIQLLEESDMDQEQKENLAYIKYSTNSLLSLLNDILDLSKIESGKMTVDLSTFDLRQELDRIIAPFRHLTAQKNIDFHIDIGEELPEEVCSDPIKMGQIINNLLSNAVKFTDKGSIKLSVNTAEEKAIQIVVKDTGLGIPAKVLDKLFKPYSQGTYSVNHVQKGTGLGLRIAKNLVDLMQGRIWVDSVENKGSIFSVIIPIQQKTLNR